MVIVAPEVGAYALDEEPVGVIRVGYTAPDRHATDSVIDISLTTLGSGVERVVWAHC